MVGIERCTWPDWTIYAIFIVFCLSLTVFSGFYLKRVYTKKVEFGYEFVEGDIKWTIGKIIKMIGIGMIVGVISGALGLGGGVIFNPLFIELGIDAQVASATGMYLVMFSSISNSLLYAMAGLFYWSWGIWLGTATAIGSILGLKLINQAVKKTGRVSLLIFMLAGVIIGSAIIIPINSLF